MTSSLVAVASAALCWRAAGPPGGQTIMLVCWLVIIQLGTLLSLIDVAVMRLPLPLVAGMAAVVFLSVGAAAYRAGQPRLIGAAVMGGLVVGGLYLLLALVLPRAMGLGDVRLAAVLGCALGVDGWTAVLLGSALPYLVAFPFAAMQLKRSTGSAVYLPFGPFLIIGAVLATILTRH